MLCLHKKQSALIALLIGGTLMSGNVSAKEYMCPSIGTGKWLSTQIEVQRGSGLVRIQCNYENRPITSAHVTNRTTPSTPSLWTKTGQVIDYTYDRHLCKKSLADCAWLTP